MERQYTAYADTGRDFIEFQFYSEHRANSKDNFKDANEYYKKKHGYRVKIISTAYNKEPIL